MLSCIPPLGLPLYDPVRGELQDSMGYWQLLIRTMLTQNLGTVMGGWRLLQPGSVSASALVTLTCDGPSLLPSNRRCSSS